MKVVRWGIIGLGKIAGKFVEDIKLVPNAKLVAVASRSLIKARSFAVASGAEHAFGSYEEMLTSGEIDMAYIATPHHLHLDNSLACLDQKIGVLCEKPAAVNAAQLKKIIDASQSSKTYFMEALWTRFLPIMSQLSDLIDSGRMGRVLEVEAEFCFVAEKNFTGRLYNPDLAGGATLDIGIYPIFLAYHLLGVPDRIEADGEIASTGVDQTMSVRMFYDDRRSAHLHASILYKSDMPARIHFERGTVLLHPRWHESKAMTILEAGEDPRTLDCPFEGRGFVHEIMASTEDFLAGSLENALWSHQQSLDICRLLDEVRSQIGVKYPFEQ